MGLNIKNPKTESLIRELAELRGVSLVTAVTEAVEHEIKRENESQRKHKLTAEWLIEITRETAPLMKDGRTTKELFDELYDPETGLPK